MPLQTGFPAIPTTFDFVAQMGIGCSPCRLVVIRPVITLVPVFLPQEARVPKYTARRERGARELIV